MNKTVGKWDELDLAGKCGTCENFIQLITLYSVEPKETARGTCYASGKGKAVYKQRFETCKKYEEGTPTKLLHYTKFGYKKVIRVCKVINTEEDLYGHYY